MGQFRKKPVVIEAFQLVFGEVEVPQWLKDAMQNGTVTTYGNYAIIKTLEGDHRAVEGDWIIQGVKGELYPCKPDIFEMTYEAL